MYILIEFALLISTLKSKSKNWLYRSSGEHHKDICIYKSHEPRAVRCGRHRSITRSTKALEVGILVAFDIQRLSSDMFRLIWAIESRHVGQIRFDPTSIGIGSFFFGWEKIWCIFSSPCQRLWQFAVQRAALSQAWSPLSPSGRDRRMPFLPWRDEDIEQLSEARGDPDHRLGSREILIAAKTIVFFSANMKFSWTFS